MTTQPTEAIYNKVNRMARKIATEAAGRYLAKDAVWVQSNIDGYTVYFVKPRTEGFFICDRKLDITAVEFYGYEEHRSTIY